MKRKFLTLALVALFSGAAFNASATEEPQNPVRYVGNMNELPLYQVALKNKTNATYVISIKDVEGNILYSEKVSGTDIVRNYQLDESPLENYELTFEVFDADKKSTDIYNISKTSKVFDEVAVEKVK